MVSSGHLWVTQRLHHANHIMNFNTLYLPLYQDITVLKLKQTLEVDDPRYLMALKYNNEKLSLQIQLSRN